MDFTTIGFGIRQESNIIKCRLRLLKEKANFLSIIDTKNDGILISVNVSNREDLQKIMDIFHYTEYGSYTIDLKDIKKILEEDCLFSLPPLWLVKYMVDYPEDEVYISFNSIEIDDILK